MGKKSLPELKYVQALEREVERWKNSLRMENATFPDTLFFGGGTPSLLSPESFQQILQNLDANFLFQPNTEKTIELNPKTADLEKMIQFRSAGLNRLSIGVQTLKDHLLHRLGRAHSSEEALQAIEWGLQAGFEKLSIDLMYGLPDQEIQDVEDTLFQLQAFPLRHLSAYELILEEETEFFEQYRRGRLPLPQEEKVFAMKRLIEQFAQQKGMGRYEVSNYSQPTQESRHNLHYWNYDSFVGLGAGAVSFLRNAELNDYFPRKLSSSHDPDDIFGYRITNPKPLDSYQKNSHQWEEVQVEAISFSVAMGEYMMMGLRKMAGVNYSDLEQKFNREIPAEFLSVIAEGKKNRWIESNESGCRLTDQGMLFSNELLEKFL